MGWTREEVIRVWKNPDLRTADGGVPHPAGVAAAELSAEELAGVHGGADWVTPLITSVVPPINFTLIYSYRFICA